MRESENEDEQLGVWGRTAKILQVSLRIGGGDTLSEKILRRTPRIPISVNVRQSYIKKIGISLSTTNAETKEHGLAYNTSGGHKHVGHWQRRQG
jgi:hypothetical protein